MRIDIPGDLAAFIASRIDNYAAEATEQYHLWEAPAVAEHVALPLIRHWNETIGLRADGEFVRWHTDLDEPHSGVRPVECRLDWVSALVEGARLYPELGVLLPVRPFDASDCICVGLSLFAPGKLICPECGGLRWVEKTVARASG